MRCSVSCVVKGKAPRLRVPSLRTVTDGGRNLAMGGGSVGCEAWRWLFDLIRLSRPPLGARCTYRAAICTPQKAWNISRPSQPRNLLAALTHVVDMRFYIHSLHDFDWRRSGPGLTPGSNYNTPSSTLTHIELDRVAWSCGCLESVRPSFWPVPPPCRIRTSVNGDFLLAALLQ
jgi:hypothetical protein